MGSCCLSGINLPKSEKTLEAKHIPTHLKNPDLPLKIIDHMQQISGDILLLNNNVKKNKDIKEELKSNYCETPMNLIVSLNDKEEKNESLNSSFSHRKLLPKRKSSRKEVNLVLKEDPNFDENSDNELTVMGENSKFNVNSLSKVNFHAKIKN
jgi:hypothetical protein